MPGEYVFIDEWDVDAPIERVFDALADAETYPHWWKPVYKQVQVEGPPGVGQVSRQTFKGRLPYALEMRSEIVALERSHRLEIMVDGDLTGHGVWTLSEREGGRVHV